MQRRTGTGGDVLWRTASEPPYPAHRQRILVVDDQSSIRHTLGELLVLEGYLVEKRTDSTPCGAYADGNPTPSCSISGCP
jgi:PleD family two-component response regulator